MKELSGNTQRLVLYAVLLGGLALRLHGLSGISLSHYDEGVYVSSGIRVAAEGWYQFAFGQPLHAPPLYPWLLSLVYWVLQTPWPAIGPYVSALLGAATLPVFYFFARRALSTGQALAAVALLAASDVHVAFSRMALTDVPLTFWFVAAMWGCARLEEDLRQSSWPRLLTTGALIGLAIGAAWNTKYNGWMPAAIAVVAAVGHVLVTRRSGTTWSRTIVVRSSVAILIIVLLATALYLPWFQYVENEYPGGYAAVTAHHRTYVGSLAQWPERAWQLLVSLPALRHFGWLTLVIAGIISFWIPAISARLPWARMWWWTVPAAVLLAGGDVVMLCIGAVLIPWALLRGNWLDRLCAVWLGSFLVLVPFYYPFVRLITPALPAAAYLTVRAWHVSTSLAARRLEKTPSLGQVRHPYCAAGIAVLLSAVIAVATPFRGLPSNLLWARWSSHAAYREFFFQVEERIPATAAIICQGQPPFSVYCPRQAVVLGNEPFTAAVEGIPPQRPAYLAVDFRVLHEPDRTAWNEFRKRLHCLKPELVIPLDANVAVLLDYLSPQQVALKLREAPSEFWKVSDRDGRAVDVPPPLAEPHYHDVIVLYGIDLQRMRSAD